MFLGDSFKLGVTNYLKKHRYEEFGSYFNFKNPMYLIEILKCNYSILMDNKKGLLGKHYAWTRSLSLHQQTRLVIKELFKNNL